MASEETDQFDHLGESEDEYDLGPEQLLSGVRLPALSTPPKSKDNQGIEDKCDRGEGRNVQGVGRPPLLPVGVAAISTSLVEDINIEGQMHRGLL